MFGKLLHIFNPFNLMFRFKLRGLAVLLTAILAASPLVSCGGEEDEPLVPEKPEVPVKPGGDEEDDKEEDDNEDGDDESQSTYSRLIVGNWFDESRNYGLTFNSDGSGNDFTGNASATNDNFTWSITGKSLHLAWEFASGETLTIVRLSETELVIDSHSYVRSDGKPDGGNTDEEAPDDGPEGDRPNEGLVDPSGKDGDQFWANHANRGEVSATLSGSGTASSPYLVRNAADLRFLSDQVRNGNSFSGKYFRMTSDIKVNSNVLNPDGTLNQAGIPGFEQWIPIGSGYEEKPTYFAGTFDGDSHTVYGVYINRTANIYGGLFGVLSGCVKNLTVRDSYVECPPYCGAIAGYALGNNGQLLIENCHSYASVSGKRAGGVVGCAYKGIVDRCSNHGAVYGYDRAGGITSFNQSVSGVVRNCVNTGSVGGAKNYVGGISGSGAEIINCVNSGTVTCSSDYAGGIVGWNFGTTSTSGIINCVNVAQVKCSKPAAIVGYLSVNSGNALVSDCYGLDFVSGPLYNIVKETTRNKLSNNHLLSESEMKSASTTAELNSRCKSGYSSWATGRDGFPTLDWAVSM